MDNITRITSILRAAFWHSNIPEVDESIFEELERHALIALPADILKAVQMPAKLRQVWKMKIYQQISFNVNYRKTQAELPVDVPYAILKGGAAAQYYPQPEYRAMGDIDIMTCHDDYETACNQLIEGGYRDITSRMERLTARHMQFFKDGIVIEVHNQYAHHNDPQIAKLIDDLIIRSITPSHILPDDINGLVLIDHINHHMESGIGLRQIIDWMMYVHKCLPDEKWPSFKTLIQQTGHEQLAIITTRMCEIYLGLPEHEFCSKADPAVCKKLMDYVLSCGNFGRKQDEDSRTSQRFLSNARTVKGTLLYLQRRGLFTWPAARKYPLLRPFAWIHQGFRYFRKGVARSGALSKLKTEYENARKRNELFDALGVVREGNGLAVYKDEEYKIRI